MFIQKINSAISEIKGGKHNEENRIRTPRACDAADACGM